MFKSKISTQTLIRLALLLLAVCVIVLCFVTCKAQQEITKLQDTVTELCGNAMTDIELNLRQGDPISSEYLLRYHQITQVYPETNYVVIADVLLSLTDSKISSALTQEDRNKIADCISQANDDNIQDSALEPLIFQIESVLAPYLYP